VSQESGANPTYNFKPQTSNFPGSDNRTCNTICAIEALMVN